MKDQNFLVLVRHGQSEWNAKNLFTGWKNPGLTPAGEKEAANAGNLIKERDIISIFIFHAFSKTIFIF